jgi:hypothetical protein
MRFIVPIGNRADVRLEWMMIKRFASASALVAVALSLPVAGSAAAATAPSTSWRPIYHTHFATNTFMTGIAAVGPKHAWAIGYDYPRGFVLSWNGKTWRRMQSFPNQYYPVAVAASSPANLWVFSVAEVGDQGQAEASRWNGHRWLQFPMPNEDIGVGVPAISSATDVWYSDGQQLLHWNGNRWSTEITPTPVAVANGPGGQVWEALAGRVGAHRSRLIVRRWNGRTWISVPVPHLPVIAGVRDVLSIASPRHVAILVATPRGSSGRSVARGAFRADGRWKIVGIPEVAVRGGFAATGQRLVWDGPDALFDGQQWLPGSALIGVVAMSGVPGTNATWAVGKRVVDTTDRPGWIWLNGKL